MGFVASKFKLGGPEPSPFAVEVNFTTSPFSITDVTDKVDTEGAAERERRARERAELLSKAADALVAEIKRRAKVGEPPMLKERHAVPFVMGLGLKQKQARELVNKPSDGRWVLIPLPGKKGHPVALFLPGKTSNDDGNQAPTEGAQIAGGMNADFRQPHEQWATEIDPSQTSENSGSVKAPISVVKEPMTSAKEAEAAEAALPRTPPLFPDWAYSLPDEYAKTGRPKRSKRLGNSESGDGNGPFGNQRKWRVKRGCVYFRQRNFYYLPGAGIAV
jgi:hypothetical protein